VQTEKADSRDKFIKRRGTLGLGHLQNLYEKPVKKLDLRYLCRHFLAQQTATQQKTQEPICMQQSRALLCYNGIIEGGIHIIRRYWDNF
jgi:hypothetical protein